MYPPKELFEIDQPFGDLPPVWQYALREAERNGYDVEGEIPVGEWITVPDPKFKPHRKYRLAPKERVLTCRGTFFLEDSLLKYQTHKTGKGTLTYRAVGDKVLEVIYRADDT